MNPRMNRLEHAVDFLDGGQDWEESKALHDVSHLSRGKVSILVRDKKGGGKEDAEERPVVRPEGVRSSWVRKIEKAIRRTSELMYRTQYEEGYWWAELESNVTITSEYIMLHTLLGTWDSGKSAGLVKYFLNMQNPAGAWSIHHGQEGDLSTTIEAYFALKLLGEDPRSEPLQRARGYILRHGGIESARVFTKIWLALFSQYDWDKVPSMPVELVLLPSRFYFSIYEFSSWARSTAVPLSIVLSIRPKLALPPEKAIQELYLTGKGAARHKKFASCTHRLFFLFDRFAKIFERRPIRSLREKAIAAAVKWILDRQEESGDWGGIQPPMVYSILALHYLGYPLDHPAIVKGLKAIEDFCTEDELGCRMQSCISPVWDTALNALALMEAGVSPEHPAVEKAGRWLIKNQVFTGGDWQVKNSGPPGGWAFEFHNTFYPDVDDSAVILNVLNRLDPGRIPEMKNAVQRGLDWCLSMQCTKGGWAAFDKDNVMDILNRIPFADHEAMVDYPTEDVTGRVLEAMGYFGYDRSHPRAQKALRFLRRFQEPDGCWWGRWGVNYIYGTWSVLRGLVLIGEDVDAPYIQAAFRWMKEHQNPDGGWGEGCESYWYPELRGQGPSTASQTAWALMALLSGDEENSPEVLRGIQYLLKTQKPDGSWDEAEFTGTGFPKHFFIRYHNYRICFPLMALGQYLQKLKKSDLNR